MPEAARNVRVELSREEAVTDMELLGELEILLRKLDRSIPPDYTGVLKLSVPFVGGKIVRGWMTSAHETKIQVRKP